MKPKGKIGTCGFRSKKDEYFEVLSTVELKLQLIDLLEQIQTLSLFSL